MYISFGEHLCSCWTEIITVIHVERMDYGLSTDTPNFSYFFESVPNRNFQKNTSEFSNDFPTSFLTTFVHRLKLIIVDTENIVYA